MLGARHGGGAAPDPRRRRRWLLARPGMMLRKRPGIEISSEHQPPAHVSQADRDLIVIAAVDPERAARLGFTEASDGRFVRSVGDEQEKANVMRELRDAGFCFSRGREWNPAEVFEWLCERGLLSGPFRSLSYTRPGEFRVREEHC